MPSEAMRACGWRKIGALYLVGEKSGIACCKLPIPLVPHFCNVCGLDHTVHHFQGWKWVDPKPLISSKPCLAENVAFFAAYCPAMDPERMGDKVGLMWVGVHFYPTAEAFLFEANAMGISKRINTLPRGFELGKTWVFLAHPRAIRNQPAATDWQLLGLVKPADAEEAKDSWTPAIFRIFRPIAVEKIVTRTQLADESEMDKLRERGITPVAVDDNDAAHVGPTRYTRGGDHQSELELANE